MGKAIHSSAIRRLPSQRTKVSVLFRDVCDNLRQHLMLLGPGAELSEAWLSQQLGTSRTPVREALIQLSNEGLVQFRPSGRCHVSTLTTQDVTEISDIRAALEAAAARTLTQRITAPQIEELRNLANTADHVELHADAREEWDKAEKAFHGRFLELAGNSRIYELLERQGLMERLLKLPISHWKTRVQADAGPNHHALVDALASGDAERCDRAFHNHIEVRKQFLIASLEEGESE